MTTVDSLPTNWEQWEAKEQRGVNRGYHLAFLNTHRMDTLVVLNKRVFNRLENPDETTITVKTSTDGEWKASGEKHSQYETTGEADEIEAQAIEDAIEWMEAHPCPRDGPRDEIELLTDIVLALRDQGMVEQHDMDIHGMVRASKHDSTTFNMRGFDTSGDEPTAASRPDDVDTLKIRVGIDGDASGLSYRQYTETDSDGETRRFHEPTNRKSLHPDIERAVEGVGFDVLEVKNGGYQTHWDYSVTYNVEVAVPDDMDVAITEVPTKSRRRRKIGRI